MFCFYLNQSHVLYSMQCIHTRVVLTKYLFIVPQWAEYYRHTVVVVIMCVCVCVCICQNSVIQHLDPPEQQLQYTIIKGMDWLDFRAKALVLS